MLRAWHAAGVCEPTGWVQRVDDQAVDEQAATEADGGTVEGRTAEDRTDDDQPDPTEDRVTGRAVLALAALALAWLAATLITANASVVGNSDVPDVALGAAAFALPNLVAAALVAGAAAGLATSARFARSGRPVRRLLAGIAAGAVIGGICAGLVAFGYGTTTQVAALAATVAAAALLGGAATAVPPPVLASGLLAAMGVLLLGLVAGFVQPGLVGLLGGGPTLDSQVNASYTVAYLVGTAGGILAGVVAFWFLRRHGSRAWPWYLLAGTLPGLLLIVTELVTRVGGASLLDIVRGLSDGDRFTVDFTAFARLRNAMIVTFVGGLTAMIAVGRTLRSTR